MEVEDNYRTEAVLRPSPPRTRVSVKVSWTAPSPKPFPWIKLLRALLNLFPTMSRPAFESPSHEVTCSCGGRQGQSTTALGGPSSLPLPGGSGEHPEKEGDRRHSDHPPGQLHPDPNTLALPGSLFWVAPGSVTRGPRTWWRTGSLWLAIVGWLDCLRPSPRASPVDTHRVLTPPVCNNRENPAT